MNSIAKARNKWNRVNGTWTLSLGTRGARVRLFENRKTGIFYRDVWVNGRKSRRSLQTRNRLEAERLGKSLLSELLSGRTEDECPTVTLGALWDRYSTECSAWLDNKRSSQKDDERSARILKAYFKAQKDVATFTENDQIRFQNARLKGGISLGDGTSTKKVRTRTVQADLVLLHSMLRWGTRFKLANGSHLLKSNPLVGVGIPRERNDLRPITTWERFQQTRLAIASLAAAATAESTESRWRKIDLAVVLAEATGRRLGSIRQLRWEDIDLAGEQITWRADADKKGKESTVPIPAPLVAELRAAQKRFGAIGGWVFSSQKNPDVPMDRHLFDRWLSHAEEVAELPKLKGGLWHPYRRKWATERKAFPITDLMAAGGWSDADTVLRSYQQSDRATLLRVMNEPHKFSDAANL